MSSSTTITNKKLVKRQERRKLWSYIRLQTTLSLRANASSKRKVRILGWFIKALILAAILGLVYYCSYALVNHSTIMDGRHPMVAIITIAQIFILIFSVSMQTRRLYKPDDIRIITSMPLTPFQRYLGEIITIFFKLFIYTFIIMWPVLLVYGAGANAIMDSAKQVKVFNTAYVFSSLFATILLPLFPFALSLVISVPFMLLKDYLKDKNIARLIIFIVLFVGILIAYGLVLRMIADLYTKASSYKKVLEGIKAFLIGQPDWNGAGGCNGYWNPCSYLSEMTLGSNFLRSGFNFGYNFLVEIGFVAAFGAAGVAITKPIYEKFTTQKGIMEATSSERKVKLNDYKSFKAIFNKEVKQILRTPEYAYFFLGVAVSMPVMTFIITDLIEKIGESSIGSNTFFGFTLLVICLIVSLIGSYSANVISREGKQFYITKIAPIPYRKQLFAKALVNFMVSFIGLTLSIVVLGFISINRESGPSLSWGDIFFMYGIGIFFLIGITFNGINIELVRPKIDMLGSETNESNIVIQIVISLAVTAIVSVFAIVVGSIYKKSNIYIELIILALMIIYALINFLIWYFTCDKKYQRMEIK